MNQTRGSRSLRIVACLSVLVGAWTTALADSPAPIPLESIQRTDVPDDRPEDWPFRQERWIPMNRQDFEQSLERLAPQTAGNGEPAFREVRYTAVFSGDALVQGRLQTEWKSPGLRRRFASLGTPNLAIDQLSWNNGPAVWGTDFAGRHWVWLDRKQGTLEGTWSRRGRPLLSGVAFDLEFLPAAVTQLQLEAPGEFTVVSDAGDVESAPAPHDPSKRLWTIYLGNLSRCRLVIAPATSAAVGVPTVLYEQETSLTIGSDDPQVLAKFQAEVLGGHVDRFMITLPRSVEIASATYGDQTPLAFERIAAEGPAAKLLIRLPEPARGNLRPIRLEGAMRRGAGESLTVPQFGMEGGLWLDGKINVTVVRPWELRSYRATGCRQSSAPTPTARVDGETIAFQQLATRSQLLLNIERPTTERVAQALNLLTAANDTWTLTTEIAFGSRSGSVYSASCRIPDGWGVASVVQLGGGRETEQLPGWEVQTHPESGQLLLMEFSEGLTPGRINALRIVAQRSRAIGESPVGWPVILPIDCEFSEVVLFGRAADLTEIVPQPGEALETFDAASAAAVWNTLPSWSRVSAATEPDARLLHVTNPDSLRLPASDETARAFRVVAEIQVQLLGDEVIERVELQLRGAPAGKEIELEMPAALAEAAWSLAETQLPLTLRRAVPTIGKGTASASDMVRFLVRLPDDLPATATLACLRKSPRTDEMPISLVCVPTARSFHGRISISADRNGSYQIREIQQVGQAADATSSAVGPLTAAEPRRWSYRTANRGWVVVADAGRSVALTQADAALRSIFSVEPNGHDLHELSVAVPAGTNLGNSPLVLPSPAELIAVLQNGRLLPAAREADRVTPSGWDAAAGGKLQVIYRTPVSALLCRTRHELTVPQLPWRCANFSWQACLPPECELHSVAGDFARTPRTPGTTWRQRLFGALSRDDNFARTDHSPGVDGRAAATPSDPSTPDETAATNLHFPPGWRVVSAEGFEIPPSASFVVWDGADLRLLSWGALLAAWPLGWWLRRRGSRRHVPWLAGLLAASGSLAVFGPESWNFVIGSACAGLIIGGMLPIERWTIPQKRRAASPDASVSTEVFRRAITPIAIGILIGRGLGSLWAQETVPNAEIAAVAPPASFRVLVPVSHSGAPSKKLPLVYVSPDLFEVLSTATSDADSEPRQLVSDAECLITREANGRLMMKVRYGIHVFSPEPPSQIRIPLEPGWQAGLEGCYLNGTLQPATAAPDGRFLNIPVEQLPRGDAPANSAHVRPWRFEALLEIRLNALSDAAAGEFHTDLFPALDRRLIWQSAVPLKHVEIPESNGLITVSLDRRSVEAALGAASAATVFNRETDQQLRSTGTTELQILQLLTLRPAVAQAAFRAECRVLDGTVTRLELKLPQGGVLREIRGHKVLQTTVQPTPEGISRVVLEFSEPLRGEFVIEGEYLLPRLSPDERVEFPRLQIACGATTTGIGNLLATASGPDYQTQLINLDDSSVLPLPVEKFVTRWGDSIPTLRPQAAFQVLENGQPAFRLTPLPAEQQILSWNEDVHVSRRKVDWTLSAELSAPRTPLLTYSLLLDRRLNIESVSVRENGVDQLWRISKTPMIGSSQNRLTLFLNRETSGTSQLRIRGSLRVRPSKPIAMPAVRFETSQSVPGTLTLSHEAGHRLVIEGRETPLEAAETPAGETPLKRLRIPEGDSGLTLRLDPLAGACLQQSYWSVAPGPTAIRVRGWVSLTPLEGTREVRLPLPEWLQNARLTTVQPGVPPLEQIEQDQRFLQWSCGSERTTPLELNWDVELPLPAADSLRLPLPTALKAAEHTAWGATAPDSDWIIPDQPGVDAESLPESMPPKLPAEGVAGEPNLFRLEGGTLPIQRRDGQSPDGRSSVWLVEHALRNTADGGWQGQTDVYPAPSGNVIAIAIPAGVELHSLLTDDVPVPLDQYDADQERWRVPNAGRHRRLTIRWQQAASDRAVSAAGQAWAFLPTSIQERQPETYVRLIGGSTEWLAMPRGGEPAAGWELAGARVETELKRQAQLQDARQPDDPGARLLWTEYRHAATLFARASAANAPSPEGRQRWETITQAMTAIAEPRSEAGSLMPADAGIAGIEPDDRIYRLPVDGADRFSCWIIREDLARWLAGSGAFVLAAGLLWRVVAWLSLPWWRSRPAAAWLACGIVWWLCFSPQLLGAAMIAWAAREWWRRPRTKPA